MIAHLKAWLRAHNLRRLEAEAHYYAVAYQAAKARYLAATIRSEQDD
jgi:hypothetical protein